MGTTPPARPWLAGTPPNLGGEFSRIGNVRQQPHRLWLHSVAALRLHLDALRAIILDDQPRAQARHQSPRTSWERGTAHPAGTSFHSWQDRRIPKSRSMLGDWAN